MSPQFVQGPTNYIRGCSNTNSNHNNNRLSRPSSLCPSDIRVTANKNGLGPMPD